MRTDDLDFPLPPELIAQEPAADRAASRLLHYRRSDKTIAHRVFSDLPALLRAGDVLVFNDARVIPARFALRKPTGGRIEGLFLAEPAPGVWRAMLRNLGQPTGPIELTFEAAPHVRATVQRVAGEGEYELTVAGVGPAVEFLQQVGRMPLPPYIRRAKDVDARDAMDRERYQTVFARQATAVAAPTAALHFTPAVLDDLDRRGVQRTFVTLDVGAGTFKPVTADTLDAHRMHSETYTISPDAAAVLNRAKVEGRRIVAVGTTSGRVLESQPAGEPFVAKSAATDIFIRPGHAWRHVGAMVTNFHLPRSTLVALVAALVGLDEQRRVYAEAIAERYRFFSYGDAMFVE